MHKFEDLPTSKVVDIPKANYSFMHMFEVVENMYATEPESRVHKVINGFEALDEFKVPCTVYVGSMNAQEFLAPSRGDVHWLVKHEHISAILFVPKSRQLQGARPMHFMRRIYKSNKRIFHNSCTICLFFCWRVTIATYSTRKDFHTAEVNKKLMTSAELLGGLMTIPNNKLARWITNQKASQRVHCSSGRRPR